MRIFSWRLIVVMIAAVSLIGYPKAARAMTIDVTVGPGGIWFFHLRLSRFIQAIRCAGLGVRAATAQRQAPRGNQTVSGILEFITRALLSLTRSTVRARSHITAFRTVDAAAWWAL